MTHEEIRLRREEIRSKAQTGKYTIGDLMTEYGLSYATVRSYCSGLKLSRTVIPSTYRVIADLINTNLPLKDISKNHKVSFSVVHDIGKSLLEAGVKIKVRKNI